MLALRWENQAVSVPATEARRRERGRGRRAGEPGLPRLTFKHEGRLLAVGARGQHTPAADGHLDGVHRRIEAGAKTAVRGAAKAERTRVVAGSIKVTRGVAGQIETHGVGSRFQQHPVPTRVRQGVARQAGLTRHQVRLGAGVTPDHGPCAAVSETLTATHGNGALEQPRYDCRSRAYADLELTCPVLSPVKVAAAEAYGRALRPPSNRSRRRSIVTSDDNACRPRGFGQQESDAEYPPADHDETLTAATECDWRSLHAARFGGCSGKTLPVKSSSPRWSRPDIVNRLGLDMDEIAKLCADLTVGGYVEPTTWH